MQKTGVAQIFLQGMRNWSAGNLSSVVLKPCLVAPGALYLLLGD